MRPHALDAVMKEKKNSKIEGSEVRQEDSWR